MSIHELKTWPEYFEDVARGLKPFEIRNDTRGYCVGDLLHLREWIERSSEYTGREWWGIIVKMWRHVPGVKAGHVVLGIAPANIGMIPAKFEIGDQSQ